MKKKPVYAILFFVFFTITAHAQTPGVHYNTNPNTYFPVNNNITLIYKSSFGESNTKYTQEGEHVICSSGADRFKYRQTLLLKEDGVYVKETYQYLKILLFIKKENTYTYGKPLLRFPLPLLPGMQWKWEGDEYSDGDTNKVKVTGRACEKEFIITNAGKFETIKVESIIEGAGGTKNIATEWYAEGVGLIKAKIVIEGGGVMGFMRDLLGYGTIEFELKEIRKH